MAGCIFSNAHENSEMREVMDSLIFPEFRDESFQMTGMQ